MKIVVSLKQVPARDSSLRPNREGNWVEDADLTYEINEPDAYALEEGLQLKEKLGGEVIVISVGPERALQTIREALAKGADRAIHVATEERGAMDSYGTAQYLAKAIEPESPELVLAGLQSDDLGYGQTGVILAEMLGFSHATIVMETEPREGAIRVKRELENGWFQYVALPLPAVLTVQSGIKKLRYATLMGIKKAKSKQVKSIPAASLGVNTATKMTIKRVYAPQRSKETQMLSGSAQETARQLVEKLRFEARVL